MRRIEVVTVSDWGGSVYVRVLTAGEKDTLDGELRETKNENSRARICAAVICDEQGERIFDESDINSLAQYSADTLQPIVDTATRINCWSYEEIEKLEVRLQTRPIRRFMVRLACMLNRTISEIEQLPCSELEEFLAYERLYGIPDIFFLTAQVCATLEMCMTNKRKYHPGDHVPYFKEDHQEQTSGEMLGNLIAATGSKDLDS